jgi:hypothetical protein
MVPAPRFSATTRPRLDTQRPAHLPRAQQAVGVAERGQHTREPVEVGEIHGCMVLQGQEQMLGVAGHLRQQPLYCCIHALLCLSQMPHPIAGDAGAHVPQNVPPVAGVCALPGASEAAETALPPRSGSALPRSAEGFISKHRNGTNMEKEREREGQRQRTFGMENLAQCVKVRRGSITSQRLLVSMPIRVSDRELLVHR